MLGNAEVGASVRPTITLDRYGHGFTDRRQASLVLEGEVWRRLQHQHGLLMDPTHAAPLGESGGGAGARAGAARGAVAARTLTSGDISAVMCVTCSLVMPGGLRASAVTSTAYSAVVSISPQLRDAVANVLVPEQASFDVALEDEVKHGEARPCALQVTRTGVTLVQSRFAQKSGHFDRLSKKGGAQQQQVVFAPDEADKARARFTLNLNGKTCARLRPHRVAATRAAAPRARLALPRAPRRQPARPFPPPTAPPRGTRRPPQVWHRCSQRVAARRDPAHAREAQPEGGVRGGGRSRDRHGRRARRRRRLRAAHLRAARDRVRRRAARHRRAAGRRLARARAGARGLCGRLRGAVVAALPQRRAHAHRRRGRPALPPLL
jgi:hypothetical protein